MRVTNSMMLGGYLKNLNNNLSTLSKLQTQMATGKRITRPSDDPVGVVSAMQTRVKLYKSEQYKTNVESALTWLDQTESSVLELNEIIKSAYERAINMASDYQSSEEKVATAELIGQLRDHVITIGNAKTGDKYIFGGYNVSKPPFVVDGTGNILYNGCDLTNASDPALLEENGVRIDFEVGFGITMEISTPGTQLFGMGEDNIYSVLDGLYNALMSDASADELGQYIEKLQNCQSKVLSVDASIGGRINRLELIQNRLEEDVLTYEARKSIIEDVDEAEAIMYYKMAEAVYAASLQIGSNIIQASLVNFLN